MRLLRSERFPALVLLTAAALGLLLANLPTGPAVLAFFDIHLGGGAIDLSLRHWVSDGLLAIFFFVAAVELRHELTQGQLRTPRRALPPAIAAAGGVVVPIAVYLAIAAPAGLAKGWPVPTATDIAFALGVLAVFGRGLPSRVRIFLLALAILDDLVGILFIAVLFTKGVEPWWLLAAAALAIAFALLSRSDAARGTAVRGIALLVLALAVWVTVFLSGVHATIAGVLLGLVMDPHRSAVVRHRLEPFVNGAVLPLFAFCAALVVIPSVPLGELSPAFWGILVALPIGKIVGITLAGLLSQRVLRSPGAEPLPLGDLLAAGALGGIGFTVSLLLGELAFAHEADVRGEVVLAVLGGSLISILISAVLVSARARAYRAGRIPEAEHVA